MTRKEPLPPDDLKISPRFVRAATATYGERDLTTPKAMMTFPWRKNRRRRSISLSAATTHAGLSGFLNLMDLLDATTEDIATLLAVSDRTARRYRKGAGSVRLERDTLERISHVLNLWLALYSVFRTDEDARRWLRSPNAAFGMQAPWDRMLAGNVSDLVDVRHQVDATLL